MAVTLGKNCILKIIYDEVPYSVRAESLNEKDDGELRKRRSLGSDLPDTDQIDDGFSGDLTVYDDSKVLDLIESDRRTRRRANLAPKTLSFTLTRVYRDGVTTPSQLTFTGVQMTVGTGMGGSKEDVKRNVSFIAADRAFVG